MGKLNFKKGTGAFPSSGLTTDALYFSVDSTNKTLEMGLALNSTTLALLNATTADRLNTSAGGELNPVYFKNGIPVACAASSSTNRWGIIPAVDANGDMYIGDKILFYTTDAGTAGPTITATTTGLTLSGTTSGTFSGSLSGNASTATKWKTARTLSWTGDATGSMSVDGSTDKSTALTLSSTGVTAGTYGASANKTLVHGETFNVPQFTVDAKGRLSKAVTYTFTLPSVSSLTIKQNQGTEAVGAESLETVYDTTATKTITINAAKARQGVYYIVGTGADATDASGTAYTLWEGTHEDITELYDGLMIAYQIAYTKSAQNVWLKINDFEEIPVMYANTSQVTTHYSVGKVVILIYKTYNGSGQWMSSAYYNADTKNTSGSTNTSSKIFLIGATTQGANPKTYSHDTAYVGTNGHLYSNSKQVVNLSDSQALTNKTYNGYTLADACAKAIIDSTSATAIGTGTSLPTERAIYYGLPTINDAHNYTSETTLWAPTSSGSDDQILTAKSGKTPVWTAQSSIAAGTANKLATARTISLSGDVSGSGTFDGSANLNIVATVLDNSHNHDYLPLTGGTLSGDLVLDADTTTHANFPSISWGGIGSASPFIGYADDQSDGTFLLMSLAGSSSYQNGLAIGGSSGNLLWKGKKVLTVEDMYFSGGAAATNDATVVGGITADTHSITVTKKEIKKGTNIKVTGGTSAITISLDGIVAVTNGGTGASTAPTKGGIIYGASTSAYGCTAAGTSGYLLKSNGESAPSWISQTSINAGTADALKLDAAVGSGSQPVYFNAGGTPTPCNYSFSNSAINLSATDGSTTAPTVQAVRNAINASFAAQDAMVFKGVITAESGLPKSGYSAGWTYKINYSGECAGQAADPGDMVIAIADGPTSGTTLTDAHWMVIQSNVDGPVFTGTQSGVGTDGLTILQVDTAGKITESTQTVGSATLPVYLNNGTITKCDNTLGVSITGNAATATKFATARTINGTNFDGSDNITTSTWGTARNFTITSSDGTNASTAVSVNGSGAVTLKLPNTINANVTGNLSGNSATATALTSSAGGATTPIYFSGGKPVACTMATSGNYFGALISIGGDGVMEIGKYIDFHASDGATTDYDYRLTAASGSLTGSGTFTATSVYGAVWNDYAEFRNQTEEIEPGYCVISSPSGKVSKTTSRRCPCDGIVSDTYGFAIGETDNCKTPLATSGRVLAYYSGDISNYTIGDAVCADADGKVSKMTREEIREWPDRIVGTVSEFPTYETWGTGNVKVNGRIWIKVK